MGKRIAMFYGDKKNTGQYDNGVWMNLLNIPFIQNLEEAGNYDLIIRTMWIEANVKGWSKEIRRRFPHVKQIGLSDHPLSTHIAKLPPEQSIAYIADIQALDGLMVLTDEELEWYSTAVPSIPVMKVGLPFPFEAYDAKYGKFLSSDKKYIGLGVGAADNDRNFVSSWLVFRYLQLLYPEIQGVFLSLPSYLVGPTSLFADQTPNIALHQREDMEQFYDLLSQCKFVINLADRNTPGRIEGEGAYFGVPVIGSDRLELQRELFPDLTVRPYELQKAVKLAALLIEDEKTGTLLAEEARKKLHRYNYASSKRKFNKLLKEIYSRG